MSISSALAPTARISCQAWLRGARRGGEARHGVGEDVGARQAELVHRARADDQRLRRVEAARDADHQLLRAGGAHARRQALHLDAVDLLAARVARRAGRRARTGICSIFLSQQELSARERQRELHGAERRLLRMPARRRRRRCSAACGRRAGGRGRRRRARAAAASAKRSRLGEQRAVLVDQRVAVPGEVGGRFARRPRRCRGRPRCSAPTGCRRARGGSRPCRPSRWTPRGWRSPSRRRARRRRRAASAPRGPRRSRRAGRASAAPASRKSRSAPNGARLPGEHDLRLARGVARRELAPLVELAVVRQVGLRHHAEQPALADERGAVVEQAVDHHRQADQRGERQVLRAA